MLIKCNNLFYINSYNEHFPVVGGISKIKLNNLLLTRMYALLHRLALHFPSKYSSTGKINALLSDTNQCHINDEVIGRRGGDGNLSKTSCAED